MNWLTLLTGLSVLLVALAVPGSLLTGALTAFGGPAALVVALLSVLFVVGLSVYGARAADETATPYW
jgi:hypothetical protein